MGRRGSGGAPKPHPGAHQERLIQRATEVIEWMMANDGHTPLTKREVVGALVGTYGRVWLTSNGLPNKALLVEVVALMHDQHDHPEVSERLGGYMIQYAPDLGGMTLVGALGEMRLQHLAHTLGGDLDIQQKALTVVRRRAAGWRTLSGKAFVEGQFDLARISTQIEREIESRGYVPDDLVDRFLEVVRDLPPVQAGV